MAEKASNLQERMIKQDGIDKVYADPLWSKHVDTPLIDCALSHLPNTSPAILLPELRFKTFLQQCCERLPSSGKLMIVDETNSRFEMLRTAIAKRQPHLYFSAQPLWDLNYADNIFHMILSEFSLAAICRAEAIFDSYRRILRPGGHIIWTMPSEGIFPAYFDLFEECLFDLHTPHFDDIMQTIRASLVPSTISDIVSQAGFSLGPAKEITFTLSFESAEQLLYSSIAESHFLAFCLSLGYPDIDGKALLTRVIRAFHHYFHGESLSLPVSMRLFQAEKV